MSVALLWHLHQPEYRDPATGRPVMPWTRLHALRGYRDLLVETAENDVPWTLNIVPGLWEQVLYYATGGTDEHQDLTGRDVDSLTAAERRRIMATFPCGNPVLRDTPRYREIEAALAERDLEDDELRDLMVLSTLVWTGSSARRDHPVFAALVEQGRGFTADDQLALVEAQRAALEEMPALLQAVAAAARPSISTTPLHHPILPLLIDLDFARRSVRRPPSARFARPGHALLQLTRGRAALQAATGTAVVGCWPSEGAVCPELIPLLADAGFRWVATDEEVLSRSTREGRGEGGWDLGHGVMGFFRDRGLSDRIGFDYARWETTAAVEDFVARSACDGVRVVALDGENPWEAFPDAGEGFRRGVIQHLHTHGVTLDEASTRPPVGRVKELHTGSWIGANLEIWAGSPSDHRAWQLLADTADAVGDHPDAVEPLLAAEGSDWFWWYGPEFDTPFAATFDEAFRGHLAAAWRAAGLQPPPALSVPVEGTPVDEPARALQPELGEPGWFGAGRWSPPSGAMARAEPLVVEYGWDVEGTLWLRGSRGVVVQIDGEDVELSPDGRAFGVRAQVAVTVSGARLELAARDWVV